MEKSDSEIAIIGVLTASDRASKGVYADASGQAIEDTLKDYLASPFKIEYLLVPDELETIARGLIELVDQRGCCLVVTTGGTGPAVRDVTPEATEQVCEKMMPGFGEQMRAVSMQYVPTAILSRQTAGIRGKSLIINLPGKPKAIRECLDAVFPAVPYCVDLIDGPWLETNPDALVAFRPKGALPPAARCKATS